MSVNYVLPVERIYFNSASLHAINYQAINNYGFEGACTIIKIVNTSDSNIFISYDGTTDHDYLGTYEDMTLNFQLNNKVNNKVSKIRKWSKVYIRGTPAKFGGIIYLIGYYQPATG